jgi:hypothetical protein
MPTVLVIAFARSGSDKPMKKVGHIRLMKRTPPSEAGPSCWVPRLAYRTS